MAGLLYRQVHRLYDIEVRLILPKQTGCPGTGVDLPDGSFLQDRGERRGVGGIVTVAAVRVGGAGMAGEDALKSHEQGMHSGEAAWREVGQEG